MRRVVLASCLVFGFVATNSLAWTPRTPEIAVAKFGGVGEDFGRAIAVDSSGNIYTTGHFNGTVDFDPGAGTTNLTSAGGNDVFVSKLNSAGELVWVKQFGGTGNDMGYSVAVDSSGNVHTTGFFSETVDFDPGAGTENLTSSPTGWTDVFVSKLNSTGAFVWAKRFGANDAERGYSIAVDSSGNVYTTGIFMNFVDFDPGAGEFILNGRSFVSKLNSLGAFVWAVSLEESSSESVVVDSSGNVYTTGQFSGTVDFDPGAGTTNLTSAGVGDIFVSKLNSLGAFVWAKRLGGTSQDWGKSVAVDSSGNVYTTGYFNETADFDPGAGTANLISAQIGDVVFVSKLNSTGDFVWAKQFNGDPGQHGYAIKVDSSGNVYTAGYFQGTVDFDPGAGTANLTGTGSNDVFVSKLDSTGVFVWAKKLGSNGFNIAYSVAVDSTGNVYTTGRFEGTGDFDPGAGTANLVSAGDADVFVSKLSSAGAAVSVTTTTTSTTTTTPAQAEEARRLEESRNAFELSERCRKANHAFNDCPLWPGNVTTSTSTSSTTSTTTPATSSTTSTTTSATSSTTLTTTPATSLTTSTTTPLKNSTPTTSPTVVTKQSLSLKVSFAQSSRRLSKPAQTNLQVLVNRLNQASNISITCSGTMTPSEIQNSKSLARNRATSVCAKLRSLGLKATFNTTSNPISKLTKNQGRFVVVAATYSSD